MDSNVSAISRNDTVPSAPLIKEEAPIEIDINQKRQELLQRLNPSDQPRIEPKLFQQVNNPDIKGMVIHENQLLEGILHFQHDIEEFEAAINTELQMINLTDDKGGNFLPKEEEKFEIPQWTMKGTHCVSTRQVREEAQKRARLELLYKEKFPEDPTPPSCDPDSDLVKKIDYLYQVVTDYEMPGFFDKWHQLDAIHELLGPEDTIAPRLQSVFCRQLHLEHLRHKEAALDVTLARLKFHREQKSYEYQKKTSQNMQASIAKIPKHNSKMLFCRNEACPDCQHKTKPSLKTHGLQKSGSRRKKPEKNPQAKRLNPSTSKRRSPSMRRSNPRRSSPARRRTPPRRSSPDRQYTPPRHRPTSRQDTPPRCRSPPRQYSPQRRRSPSGQPPYERRSPYPAPQYDYHRAASYDGYEQKYSSYDVNSMYVEDSRDRGYRNDWNRGDGFEEPPRQQNYNTMSVRDRLY